MPQEVFTDYDGLNRLAQEFLAKREADNAVPILGEGGEITGFYDQRKGPPEGQPGQERLSAHLEYLKQVNPQYVPKLGSQIPQFQRADPYESEGLLDSLGNIARAGASESIEGLAYQAATGEQLFDTEGFQPNFAEKIGIEVASFISPAGIGSLFLGGGVGGALVKAAVSKTLVKTLIKGGLKSVAAKATAKKIAIEGATTALEKKALAEVTKQMARIAPRVAANMATSAASLGTFEAVRTPIAEMAAGKDSDLSEFLSDALKGFAHGAGMGAALGAAGGAIPSKIAGSTLLSSTAKFGAEVGVFGSAAPFVEGRVPTAEDYLDAAAFIGVMKGVGVASKRFFGAKSRQIKDEVDRKVNEGETESEAFDNVLSEEIAINQSSEGIPSGKITGDVVKKPVKKKATKKRDIGVKKLSSQVTARRSLSNEVFGKESVKGVVVVPHTITAARNKGKKTITVGSLRNAADLETLQKFVADNPEFTNINFSEKFEATDLFKALQDKGFVSTEKTKVGFRAIEPEGIAATDRSFAESMTELRTRPTGEKPTELGGIAATAATMKDNVKTFSDLSSFAKETVNNLRSWGRQTLGGLMRAKRRVKDPDSKELFDGIDNVTFLQAKYDNVMGERMKDMGLGDIKTAEQSRAVVLKIKKGELPQWNDYFKRVRQAFIDINKKHDPTLKDSDIIGDVEFYTRRQLTRDISDKLLDSMNELKKLLPREGIEGSTEKQIIAALATAAMKKRGFRVEGGTVIDVALDHLVKHGKFKTMREALLTLNREVNSEMFGRSSAEMHRVANLPENFYESDIRIWGPDYASLMSRRMAEVQVFGPNGKKALELVEKVKRANPEEGALLQKVLSIWTGVYYQDKPISPFIRKAIDTFTGFQVGMKIGLGRGTALNFTQTSISTMPLFGVFNHIRAGIDVFNPAKRKFLKRAGITDSIDKRAIEAMVGDVPGGVWGKFAAFTTKWSGFQAINKANLYWAGATYMRGVKQWIPQARGTGRQAELRRKQLKDFGIDYRKDYTDDQLAQGMFKFATNSQLLKNILEEPLFFNDPILKPFLLFKRFGVRQAFWIKDMMTTEIKRGNYAPIVRLALGGWAGGGAVVWALNNIKEHLSGQPQYRKDDDIWDQITTNIAMTGALGVVSDMIEMDKASDLMRRLKFTAYPVVVSDLERVMDVYTSFMKDWERYGDGWLATERNAYKVFSFAGSYPRYAAERLKTESQAQRTQNFRKRQEKEAIYDLLLNANKKAAQDRMMNWNSSFPDNKLNMNDFQLGGLIKYLRRQMKKHIDAQAIAGTPKHRELTKKETILLREKIKKLKEKFNSK